MMATEQTPTMDGAQLHSITDMSSEEARQFLLKGTSYCKVELPPYFCFDDLLQRVAHLITQDPLPATHQARRHEGVNYRLLSNKDGRYAWRPFEIIHPALYVALVANLTESTHWETICNRFRTFKDDAYRVTCLSLPGESLTDESDAAERVTEWWFEVEQKSIQLSLDYEFMVRTDVVDCYAAIYTHSIAWALHGRDWARARKGCDGLIGNRIDKRIQDMHQGQTNGIPQGSVLMDFVAEMVLGYADCLLTDVVDSDGQVGDYRILRYRDDYRIFVHTKEDAERILKHLTSVLSDLGLKLSPDKTHGNSDVVGSSIKSDKLAWMFRRQRDRNLQKHLLAIYDHSKTHPNGGSLKVALDEYHSRLEKVTKHDQSRTLSLISIVTAIALDNPGTYPMATAVLSRLIGLLEGEASKRTVILKIQDRFSRIPNTGHMDIWLQRISLRFRAELEFSEPLCRRVVQEDEQVSIWNSEWLPRSALRTTVDSCAIVDEDMLRTVDPIVSRREVALYVRPREFYW